MKDLVSQSQAPGGGGSGSGCESFASALDEDMDEAQEPAGNDEEVKIYNLFQINCDVHVCIELILILYTWCQGGAGEKPYIPMFDDTTDQDQAG